MGTGLGRILPVQNDHSSYDVAALNNLYARARRARRQTPDMSLNPSQQDRLSSALRQIEHLAGELEGQPEGLLALLRQLEHLHRSIQDGAFRSSLPADRSQLFSLLQSVERSGGWPYIPRLQLRTFMDLLQHEPSPDGAPDDESLAA
ncbi:MAG: hypothetical protein RLZZ268_1043 [Cyanobacteriota bacterium]